MLVIIEKLNIPNTNTRCFDDVLLSCFRKWITLAQLPQFWYHYLPAVSGIYCFFIIYSLIMFIHTRVHTRMHTSVFLLTQTKTFVNDSISFSLTITKTTIKINNNETKTITSKRNSIVLLHFFSFNSRQYEIPVCLFTCLCNSMHCKLHCVGNK